MTRTTRGSNTSNSNSKTRDDTDDIRQWPWQAQFAALLFVLAIAAFLIVLPVLVVRVLDTEYAFSSETDLWAAMIAILLGLTTMTVSGVFVFMTFRIDRGARLEAQKTAKKEATKAMTDYGKGVVNGLETKLELQFNESQRKINDLYSSVHDDVFKTVNEAKKQVSNAAADVKEKMFEAADNAKEKMFEAADDAKEKMFEAADDAKKDVSQLTNKVKDDVSQFAEKVEGNVSQFAEKSVKAVQYEIEKGNQSIQEKFDKGIREIGDLFESARKAADDADETPNGDSTEGSSEK